MSNSSRPLPKKNSITKLILIVIVLFCTACSVYGFGDEVGFRLRNLIGKYLKQGLILDRNPKDGRVSGIYRDEQGQKVEFNVDASGFTTILLYTRSEVLPKLLQVTHTCDAGTCLYFSYIDNEGNINFIDIDGFGELSDEERIAMTDLMNNDLVQGLSLLPLDIACQGLDKADPVQVAALLYPLQMLFKYQIADRATAASELIALSQCDYGSRTEGPDKYPAIIELTPSNPVPVVVGYFPFDEVGAIESPSASVDGQKLACQDPSRLLNSDSVADSALLPDLSSFGSGPIRDEYGFCQAKCRGACGADCTINNCQLSTEDRCEKNQDGENNGFISLVYIYDCGLHPACIKHDECYDDCNRRYGCNSWGAAYCMHAETIVSTPFEFFTGTYLSCDSEAIIEEGLINVKDWVRGYGPQPIRQIYEYTDKANSYDYDPVSCPVGENSGEEEGAGNEQDPVTNGSEDAPTEESENQKEGEGTTPNDGQGEVPTEDVEPGDTDTKKPVDPCDLLAPNGAIMDRDETYCRREYNVDPYISATIFVFDSKPDTTTLCKSFYEDDYTLVMEQIDMGDCGYISLINFVNEKPDLNSHAGWEIAYVYDRFQVSVYTYDVYATNKVWLEELASKVEENISNYLK